MYLLNTLTLKSMFYKISIWSSIPKKKYAMVGENGAGKTTIVKLLLRLYDPSEGKILINGIDLKRNQCYRASQTLFRCFSRL